MLCIFSDVVKACVFLYNCQKYTVPNAQFFKFEISDKNNCVFYMDKCCLNRKGSVFNIQVQHSTAKIIESLLKSHFFPKRNNFLL